MENSIKRFGNLTLGLIWALSSLACNDIGKDKPPKNTGSIHTGNDITKLNFEVKLLAILTNVKNWCSKSMSY